MSEESGTGEPARSPSRYRYAVRLSDDRFLGLASLEEAEMVARTFAMDLYSIEPLDNSGAPR